MLNTKLRLLQNIYMRPAFWLACLAAISYSSWPLSYVLNPNVGHHQLASQLEAPHQPFNWLFISTDILTGLFLIIVAIVQIRTRHRRLSLNLSIIGYTLFGLLVALTAMLPLNCDPSTSSCGPLLQDPRVIVHGISSILSVLFLLASLLTLTPIINELQASKLIRLLFACVIISWIVFGLGALVEISFRITGNILQNYFITICSLSIIFVISAVEYAHLLEQHQLIYEPAKIEEN